MAGFLAGCLLAGSLLPTPLALFGEPQPARADDSLDLYGIYDRGSATQPTAIPTFSDYAGLEGGSDPAAEIAQSALDMTHPAGSVLYQQCDRDCNPQELVIDNLLASGDREDFKQALSLQGVDDPAVQAYLVAKAFDRPNFQDGKATYLSALQAELDRAAKQLSFCELKGCDAETVLLATVIGEQKAAQLLTKDGGHFRDTAVAKALGQEIAELAGGGELGERIQAAVLGSVQSSLYDLDSAGSANPGAKALADVFRFFWVPVSLRKATVGVLTTHPELAPDGQPHFGSYEGVFGFAALTYGTHALGALSASADGTTQQAREARYTLFSETSRSLAQLPLAQKTFDFVFMPAVAGHRAAHAQLDSSVLPLATTLADSLGLPAPLSNGLLLPTLSNTLALPLGSLNHARELAADAVTDSSSSYHQTAQESVSKWRWADSIARSEALAMATDPLTPLKANAAVALGLTSGVLVDGGGGLLGLIGEVATEQGARYLEAWSPWPVGMQEALSLSALLLESDKADSKTAQHSGPSKPDRSWNKPDTPQEVAHSYARVTSGALSDANAALSELSPNPTLTLTARIAGNFVVDPAVAVAVGLKGVSAAARSLKLLDEAGKLGRVAELGADAARLARPLDRPPAAVPQRPRTAAVPKASDDAAALADGATGQGWGSVAGSTRPRNGGTKGPDQGAAQYVGGGSDRSAPLFGSGREFDRWLASGGEDGPTTVVVQEYDVDDVAHAADTATDGDLEWVGYEGEGEVVPDDVILLDEEIDPGVELLIDKLGDQRFGDDSPIQGVQLDRLRPDQLDQLIDNTHPDSTLRAQATAERSRRRDFERQTGLPYYDTRQTDGQRIRPGARNWRPQNATYYDPATGEGGVVIDRGLAAVADGDATVPRVPSPIQRPVQVRWPAVRTDRAYPPQRRGPTVAAQAAESPAGGPATSADADVILLTELDDAGDPQPRNDRRRWIGDASSTRFHRLRGLGSVLHFRGSPGDPAWTSRMAMRPPDARRPLRPGESALIPVPAAATAEPPVRPGWRARTPLRVARLREIYRGEPLEAWADQGLQTLVEHSLDPAERAEATRILAQRARDDVARGRRIGRRTAAVAARDPSEAVTAPDPVPAPFADITEDFNLVLLPPPSEGDFALARRIIAGGPDTVTSYFHSLKPSQLRALYELDEDLFTGVLDQLWPKLLPVDRERVRIATPELYDILIVWGQA